MVSNDIIKEVSEQLLSEDLKVISPQQAHDQKLFGPVYHGTTSDKLEKIATQGFNVFVGHERSGNVSHGYEVSDYYGGIPSPIHHLGFGVYFTTVRSIAKNFGYGSTQLGPYFLNAPNLLTINFGSPRTMMKWWLENGYNYNKTPETTFGNEQTSLVAIRKERLRATLHMTEFLKTKYDAVWFKGRGIKRLLDGDQVVIFDPSRVYKLDKKLAQPGEIGSRVVSKVTIDPYQGRAPEYVIPIGMKGTIVDKKKPHELQTWAAGAEWIYQITWDKGGKMYDILDTWVQPYMKSTRKKLTENKKEIPYHEISKMEELEAINFLLKNPNLEFFQYDSVRKNLKKIYHKKRAQQPSGHLTDKIIYQTKLGDTPYKIEFEKVTDGLIYKIQGFSWEYVHPPKGFKPLSESGGMAESDAEHGEALRQTGYWGRQGAGAIILAQDTGRILLPYRSRSVEQPHTWGVWGGAIDAGEDPAEAVKREISEEVGYSGIDMNLIPMYVYRDPRVGFQYSNFLAIVPKEFVPKLNWETENYRWTTFGEWPTPLHFGLKALLQNSGDEILEQIKKLNKTPDVTQPAPMDKTKYNASIDIIRRTWAEMARGGDYSNRFDYDNNFVHWMQNEKYLSDLIEKYGQQFYPNSEEPGYEFQNDVEKVLEMLENRLNQRRANKINKNDPLYLLKQAVRGRTWKGAKQALSYMSWTSRGRSPGQITDDLAENIFNRLYRIALGETFYEKDMFRDAIYLDAYILSADSPSHIGNFIRYYNGRKNDRFPTSVKVYRGLSSPVATIRPGDHVTFEKGYARAYEAGKLGTVISAVLPSKDLLVTKPDPGNSELVYWPPGHQIKRVENVPTFREFYNQWAFA